MILHLFLDSFLNKRNATLGEQNAALDQLEYLMSIPCPFSVHYLKIDPELDPLRNNPRFKRLLEQEDPPKR